jgi:hypothetical protein
MMGVVVIIQACLAGSVDHCREDRQVVMAGVCNQIAIVTQVLPAYTEQHPGYDIRNVRCNKIGKTEEET